MDKAAVQKFYELETSLHQKEIRNSREKVSTLIANDFLEYGKSGGVFHKQDILAGLEQEAIDFEITVSDFSAKKLAENVILVTYTASMLDEDTITTVHTNRSSIWIMRDEAWQMIFHQGTKR